MSVFLKIVLSFVAFGAIVFITLMLISGGTAKERKYDKQIEFLQQGLYFAAVAIAMYYIWWVL